MSGDARGGQSDVRLDVAKEFLLAEYAAFREAFAKNEELGERRVQFFLGLVTAATGAVTLLSTAEHGPIAQHRDAIIWIALGLAVLLLAAGLLTFDRLLRRDEVSDEYKSVLDEVRARIVEAGPVQGQPLSLAGYHPFTPKPRTLGRLSRMTLAINGWIAATAALLLYVGVLGRPVAPGAVLLMAAGAIAAAIAAGYGQRAWWVKCYRSKPPRQAGGQHT